MGVDQDYLDKIEKDRGTRFSFLLEKTEIFAHFLNTAGKKPPKSPLKMKKQEPPSKQKKEGNSKEYVSDFISFFNLRCFYPLSLSVFQLSVNLCFPDELSSKISDLHDAKIS